MKKTLSELHAEHYATHRELLQSNTLTPELRAIVEKEIQRHEELYLKYSAGQFTCIKELIDGNERT